MKRNSRVRGLMLAGAILAGTFAAPAARAGIGDPEWIEGRVGTTAFGVCIDKNPTGGATCPDGKAVWTEKYFASGEQAGAQIFGYYAAVCYDVNASDGLECDGRRVTWSAGKAE